ncbi:MAG: hypothetical protein K1X42_08785 [Opitutaceae bacterium]|nr:hypothetical protein [Opitutaceae bacterium]
MVPACHKHGLKCAGRLSESLLRSSTPSPRDSSAAAAFGVITPNIQSGQLFMPMHFAHVNRLTHPSFDPHSRQPCYKACAVRIDRAPTGLDEAASSF